ncbi:MAG TPA: MFS transporter, partial [Xanthobacteraceae bacterium]|nr:MFS transporter [Xanthobacteraceae bacterium]
GRCYIVGLPKCAGRAKSAEFMLHATVSSVETKSSWVVASMILVVMAVAFGAPWITIVALKDIAAEVGGERSVPAFASALMWIGAGVGGILMGRVAERVGVRWTVIFGAAMIAVGLAVSTLGPSWPLYIGHGLFIGLIGIGGINAPSYVYISRWFDRRRGSALALISSGSYLAGAIWPPIFARAIDYAGWRHTMLYYAAFELLIIAPAAAVFLERPPDVAHHAMHAATAPRQKSVLGWPPNLVFGLQMGAIFTCCIPMSMPQGHLVALCTDRGISAASGAAMISVLLGAAFFTRQVWGVVSDKIGGLYTMLAGSACQALGMLAFLLTQSEVGLFTVAALFGMGFSGLVPANVLASREMFPVDDAYWRMPMLLLCSGFGMALGGWLAGVLYDYFGFYAPAFAAGLGVNIINLMIISTLALRKSQTVTA